MPASEKQIRVFISSTFRDMHAERDHLVTVVFPELRERCERLGLEFFDVDLRWGVPEKGADGETANSWEYCRQWIDRVEPLFVCILGQRYGWVPQVGDFRDEADRARQASHPRSITDLEVRHAVLNDRRKRRSYFYLRSAEAPANASEFVDPPPLAGKLQQLKREVRSCGRPVRDYPCAWTGSGFTGLDEYGQLVLEDLWSGVLRDPRYVSKEVWTQTLGTDPDSDPRYIDESQPVSAELAEKIVALAKPPPVSPLDAERQQMESFAASRLRWFQGRTHELEQLTGFVRSTAEEAPRLAVVAAAAGQGKSALLAKLWQSLQPSGSQPLASSPSPRACDGALVVAHFVGATERSASEMEVVRRLLAELDRSGIAWPEEKTGEEPKLDFNSLCRRLAERLGGYAGGRRIVILLDALNQLSDGHDLLWLPPKLGSGVRVVVSCVEDPAATEGGLEQRVLKALAHRQSESLRVPLGPLKPAEIRTVVTDYLREYCKELDAPPVDAFCDLPQARNPLYLLVALGELRTLGGNDMNRKVPELIAWLPKTHPDTVSLFKWVLERLEVFGTEEVRYWCLYLALGRVGMASHELADLLQRKLGEAAAAKALLIERGLRRYLQRRGGQLDFFHGQLRRAVMERYGAENAKPSSRGDAAAQRQRVDRAEESCQPEDRGPSDRHSAVRTPQSPILLHREVADYFTGCAKGTDPQNLWKSDHVRGFAECVYHQAAAQSWDEVERTLSDFGFLIQKTRLGLLEGLFDDWAIVDAHAPTNTRLRLEVARAFFREKAHILRRGNPEWPAYKILLQLAVEHADDSPLTLGAENFLVEGRCDWIWLRRVPRLRHAQKERCMAVLEGHSSPSGAIELADGRLLSWAGEGTLRLWSGQTGMCLVAIEGHTEDVNGALELTDGRLLSWSADRTLRLWDGQSGACLAVLEGHSKGIDGALELADGRLLSWSWDKTLRLWDGNGRVCLAVLRGHTLPVWGALRLSDGSLLSWSGDGTLRLWDGQVGAHMDLAVFAGHASSVSGARELADGRLLSWSGDCTVRLWDRHNGDCLAVLAGHGAEICGALDLGDGRLVSWCGGLMEGSSDHTLRLWDSGTGQCLAVLAGHTDVVNGAIGLADDWLISWSRDTTLRLWRKRDGACLSVLRGHTGPISGAQKLPDDRLLSWSEDKTMRLWGLRHGACLDVLKGHIDYVSGARSLADGRLLSWSSDGSLRLWDGQARSPRAVRDAHDGPVGGALALSGSRFVTWSDDCSYVDGANAWSVDRGPRLWDGGSGKTLAVFEGHSAPVCGMLSLASCRLLSWTHNHGTPDNTLRVWDDQTGTCLKVLEGHSEGINGALELADGRLLSWSRDKTLRLWDGQSSTCLAVLEGHSEGIDGALELADRRLLSWSWDKTLRLWDAQNATCLAMLEGHSEGIDGALELADGRLLSWSRDETFRLWDEHSGACLETAAEHIVPYKHPDWLCSLIKELSPRRTCFGFFVFSRYPHRVTYLCHSRIPATVCAWCTDWDALPRFLLPDGSAVVTQDDGQVCLLMLYHGRRRVSLAEAEAGSADDEG